MTSQERHLSGLVRKLCYMALHPCHITHNHFQIQGASGCLAVCAPGVSPPEDGDPGEFGSEDCSNQGAESTKDRGNSLLAEPRGAHGMVILQG